MPSRPLRLAYVCADRGIPLTGRSGSGVHIREMVKSLCRGGTEVTVLTANPGADGDAEGVPCPVVSLGGDALLNDLRHDIAKEARRAGDEGSRPSEIYSLLSNQTLATALNGLRGRIDAVYERSSLWSYAALQFALREGLPYFLEVNARLVQQQRDYRRLELAETAEAIEGLLFSRATCVLPTTAALGSYVHERGATRRRIRVLPCGVSSAFFARDLAAAGKAREEFVVGFVGSLKPWHGVETLLEAFLQLSYRSSSYRLLIVGDGPMRADVEEFRRRHHLGSAVEIAGAVDHGRVPELLARMHVGVASFPPLASFDYSPLKVWEYAAAGVPIVASASGELPQIFPHKVSALLHPAGSVGKIIKHVELLRQSPDLAQRLARRARRRARAYTWDRLAARLATLATRAVSAPRRQPRT